jgi:hypothetical protein
MQIRPMGDELFHAHRETDVRTDGPTEIHDDANGPFFSHFCDRA